MKMVKFDWLEVRMRALRWNEEWKCATIEYGGQCVQMDGMNLLLILPVTSLDTQTLVS